MADATHVYHPGLANYDEQAVFQDGCPVCEGRARDLQALIAYTDPDRLQRLWDTVEEPRSHADATARDQLRLAFRAMKAVGEL